jgi:G:T/U-mismatch repair DNA glycosylase
MLLGLLPVKLTTKDDTKLNDYGLGVTCLCQRATSSTAELADDEWKQGRPNICCYNEALIYIIVRH